MFTLTIHDTQGAPLNSGDWVRLDNVFGRIIFYTQVELFADGRLSPFDTFSFSDCRKIDRHDIPDAAKETGYGFVLQNANLDEDYEQFRDYLMNIRELEMNRSKFYSISLS